MKEQPGGDFSLDEATRRGPAWEAAADDLAAAAMLADWLIIPM